MIRRSFGLVAASLFLSFASTELGAQAPATAPSQAPQPTAGSSAPTGPAPQIKFEKTDVNLGDVVRGQDAVATFTYQNTGNAPLHILSAKPG
jgi:hypothetical protein